MDYVELSVGASIIALGAIIWLYIKRAKSRFQKCILRGNSK